MKKRQSVIAVFDIGKTNKKLLVFDTSYQVVAEETTNFAEELDEDGFPCENIDMLTAWVLHHVHLLKQSKLFHLKAVNFSTYGASLLYIDAQGERVGPLYNYLKPYPQELLQDFYAVHGDKDKIALETSSPIMGHLNAGLQVYWLKQQRPELYKKIASVLHFPQYLSFQLTGKIFAEMTNVGCHSAMWDFKEKKYHSWLQHEGIQSKLSTVVKGNEAVVVNTDGKGDLAVGVGLHDSSAAIIPYLISFKEPFIIVSTGTWTITLNPFNQELPQTHELSNGCLSYHTYQGNPVKISMLFAGHDHDEQVKRLANYYKLDPDYFKTLEYDPQWIQLINRKEEDESILKNAKMNFDSPTERCVFHLRNLSGFKSAEHAYHQLMMDSIKRQAMASRMTISNSDVKKIYVDGGFGSNKIYMQLLTDAFPDMQVYAASMIQGTALGAALAIHHQWNKERLPDTLINLKHWPKSVPQPTLRDQIKQEKIGQE